MALILAFALQAAVEPAGSAALLPVAFDLATARPAGDDGCGGGGSEIVVCGRRAGGAYPMEEMARIFEPKPLVAETALGGGVTGRVFVESVTMPDGQVSNRAMIGIKTKF